MQLTLRRPSELSAELEERIESLMLEGKTKEAIALATQPLTNEVLLSRADRIKREVFENAERFPYYHGDIKREVDALLESQPGGMPFRDDIEPIFGSLSRSLAEDSL